MYTVPIVLASDAGYLPFAYTTIYSVLKSRKAEYKLLFYIMVPVGTILVNYDEQWKFENYKIEYIEVSNDYFSDAPITINHITKPTYYRLLISEYLKKYKKCIYLDVDLLACSDLSALYGIDIEEQYLAAGLGIDVLFTEESEKILARYLGIESAKEYFNAGVLVMNLEKIRKEGLVNSFFEYSTKPWNCQDQDVLNICCYEKTKIFHLKYNIYSIGYGYERQMLKTRFSEQEIKVALENPCIIHYATALAKPWKNLKTVMGDLWWEIACSALPDSIYQEIRQKAEDQMLVYHTSDIVAKVKSCSKMIIFGCGQAGKQLFDFLEAWGKEEAVYEFWDNAAGYEKRSYQNVPIVKPQRRDGKDLLVVISVQREQEEIKKQLYQLEFDDDNIVVYRFNDIEAWFGTDPKYRW